MGPSLLSDPPPLPHCTGDEILTALYKLLERMAAAGAAEAGAAVEEGKNDLHTWLTSVHGSLLQYAHIFEAMGYDDLGLIKGMNGAGRSGLLAALDEGKIKPGHRRKMVAALEKLLGASLGEKQPSPSPRCHCYSGDDYGEMDNHTLSFSIHLRASFFLVFILFLRPMCIPIPHPPSLSFILYHTNGQMFSLF